LVSLIRTCREAMRHMMKILIADDESLARLMCPHILVHLKG
jgi:hypothetical protein